MSDGNLKLDLCSNEAAKYAVLNWHYSKCMPVGKLFKIGVWESNVFIGCVIFGYGNNQYQGKAFGLLQTEVCELLRVALNSHVNAVTKIVSIAIRILKKYNPGIKLIVSYADPAIGHIGGIYQGGNWVYVGRGGSREAYFDEFGKRLHSRRVGKGGVKIYLVKYARVTIQIKRKGVCYL